MKAMVKCSNYSELALESRKSRIKKNVPSEWRNIIFGNDSCF